MELSIVLTDAPATKGSKAGALRVEAPAGHKKLDCGCIISSLDPGAQVQVVRLFDLIHFDFNSKARAFRDFYSPIQDSEWLARKPLSFLPDPM